VPNPTVKSELWYSANADAGQTCTTGLREGVYGQYGAQGFFIDGCTAVVRCPSYARWCNITGHGFISDANYAYVSMNARLRMFDSRGALLGFKDTACTRSYKNCTTQRLTGTLGPNGIGTVQCNGVRYTTIVGRASNTCHVEVFANLAS
jgi:hypothetical protein